MSKLSKKGESTEMHEVKETSNALEPMNLKLVSGQAAVVASMDDNTERSAHRRVPPSSDTM